MADILKRTYRIIATAGYFKSLIVVGFAALAGIAYSYKYTSSYNPTLFYLASFVVTLVVFVSLRKYRAGKIPGSDVVGNILTTALIAYFSIVLYVAVNTSA